MAKSYRQKMLEKQRKYQSTYRDRMRLDGWKQVTLWLDPETARSVENLKGKELSTFVCHAVNSVTTSKLTCKPESEFENKLTSEIESDLENKPTSDITSKATQAKISRYMNAELEDRILALRESGLSLEEIGSRLASEGHLSATGRPYTSSTLAKAVKRARDRTDS